MRSTPVHDATRPAIRCIRPRARRVRREETELSPRSIEQLAEPERITGPAHHVAHQAGPHVARVQVRRRLLGDDDGDVISGDGEGLREGRGAAAGAERLVEERERRGEHRRLS
jgi:hypothetical protein